MCLCLSMQSRLLAMLHVCSSSSMNDFSARSGSGSNAQQGSIRLIQIHHLHCWYLAQTLCSGQDSVSCLTWPGLQSFLREALNNSAELCKSLAGLQCLLSDMPVSRCKGSCTAEALMQCAGGSNKRVCSCVAGFGSPLWWLSERLQARSLTTACL